MKTFVFSACIAAASIAFGAGVTTTAEAQSVRASAADGALVGLHDLRREGNKTCMVGHSHNGSSYGMRSRNQAEATALRNWSEFTALEYGGHWGSPSLASDKSMKCSTGGSGWNCDFDARPCKR
jgi:hypothetical protein